MPRRDGSSLLLFSFLCYQKTMCRHEHDHDDSGQGEGDDDQNDQSDMLPDPGYRSKEVSGAGYCDRPAKGGENIVAHEFAVFHGPDSGKKGGKCPDNGDKPPHKNGLSPEPFEIPGGPIDIL